MENVKVDVILVTYNRLECLKKALDALQKQNYPIHKIFVYNNASIDGTDKYLENSGFTTVKSEMELKDVYPNQKLITFLSSENLGGAGGFSASFKYLSQFDSDYIWIMDDDVAPTSNCLEELLKYLKKEKVKAVIPRRVGPGYTDSICTNIDMKNWRKFWTWWRKDTISNPTEKETYSVVDMAFEGPLFDTNLVRQIGTPDAEFFILYDDTDYSQRILKYTKILYVTNAILNRQLPPKAGDLGNKPYNWRMYYRLRNNIVFDRKYGENWCVKHISPRLLCLQTMLLAVRDHHVKSNVPLIWKAYRDGMKHRMGKRVDPNY